MSLRRYAIDHRFAGGLTAVALAGFVLRIVYTLANRHHPVGGDGFRYHYEALLLADGRGFVSALGLAVGKAPVPDTGHPPAFTILLAAVSKVGLRTWLEHQLVTNVIGTATIVMVGLATKAAVGARTALIAAALGAFYPFFWLYEREVVSEPLALLGIATLIWLAYRFLAEPRWWIAVALGATVGAVAMTKSDQIVIAFVLVTPLILFRRDIALRRRVSWLASAGAVCVVIMAPWSIYLSNRFDRPVLLTGAVGQAMLQGNCPKTYSGQLLGYYAFGCGLTVRDSGNPIVNDSAARKRADAFIRSHEGRAILVSAAREGRTFGFFRPFQQMHLETERSTSLWVFRVGFFAYWVLLPFAILGVVVARRRKIAVYPILVFPLVVAFTVLLTIGAVRYRAPAEIPLVMLAAIGVDRLVCLGRKRPNGASSPVRRAHDQPIGGAIGADSQDESLRNAGRLGSDTEARMQRSHGVAASEGVQD